MSLLGQLQKLESANDAARKRLGELDAALADERTIVSARELLDSRVAQLEVARKELRAREEETRVLETKMKELEERLYGGRVRNPKELENLERELVMFRQLHERLDETTLVLMEAVDSAESEERTAREHLQQLQTEQASAKAAWARERQALLTSADEAARAIEQARKGLADEVLEAYERLRRRMPLAAAPVRHGLCGLCGIGVPEAAVAQARDGQTVVRCDNCGRILYVE